MTIPDVNCEGTFSSCSAACELAADRSFTQTKAKSGNGSECPTAEDCKPGDGACVADVNCEGTFSSCSAACELAADRVFTITKAKSGNGSECPTAEDCKPGDGACVVPTTAEPTTYLQFGLPRSQPHYLQFGCQPNRQSQIV
jgi:hypothetical protein